MKKLNGNQVTLVAPSSIPKSGNRNGTYGTWKEKTPLDCHCDICDNLKKICFQILFERFDGLMVGCSGAKTRHVITPSRPDGFLVPTGCLAFDHCRTLWTGDEAQIGFMYSCILA